MRIVSLLPSASEIVWALGLGEELVGVAASCDWPPEISGTPVVTRGLPDRSAGAREDFDRRLAETLHFGAPRQVLDDSAIRDLAPDLVFTQERCDVCGVSFGALGGAVRRLGLDATVVSLEPTSVEGILNAISTVGAMAGAEDAAVDLVGDLREQLSDVERRILDRRQEGHRPVRAVALEQVDPPFAAGHWIPEQVRRAGGWDLLGHEGERSAATTWAAVEDVDPDVLLLMPSGLHLEDAVAGWRAAVRPPRWRDLDAVRREQVFAVDAAGCFGRPGPRVVDGIAILAAIFDPDGFAGRMPLDAAARIA